MRSFVKFKPGQQGNRSNNRRYGEIRYEREMSTWRPFRYCGLMASFCAMLLGCVAAWSRHWVSGREFNIGIWDMCFYNETEDHTIEFCLEKRALWQTSVIGLMIMSLAFGPLATVLSIFGLCSTSLQKKIYYFNSAGEIYLICGLSSLAALIVYSVAIEIERKMSAHSFGYAFGLCCGSTGFFLVAALCMCVDDVVETVTNIFCKSDNDDDDDVRV